MEHIVGVALGASALFAGYVLHKLSDLRSQDLSYLLHVPQFSNFRRLKEHLQSSPDQTADVLVQGTVEKLGDASLYSENAGMEGAARVITTTNYTKVYHEESAHRKWRDMANTMENLNVSLPFKLVDSQGNSLRVESVHKAGGFRRILQSVYQEKTLPEKRTMGDYATNVTLREIPNGSLTREFLLVFGTSLAGFGKATLQKQSMWSGGEIVFIPGEVGSSIRDLISRNEVIVRVYKFFALVFVVAGGSILIFTVAPLLMRLLSQQDGRRQPAIES